MSAANCTDPIVAVQFAALIAPYIIGAVEAAGHATPARACECLR